MPPRAHRLYHAAGGYGSFRGVIQGDNACTEPGYPGAGDAPALPNGNSTCCVAGFSPTLNLTPTVTLMCRPAGFSPPLAIRNCYVLRRRLLCQHRQWRLESPGGPGRAHVGQADAGPAATATSQWHTVAVTQTQ